MFVAAVATQSWHVAGETSPRHRKRPLTALVVPKPMAEE